MPVCFWADLSSDKTTWKRRFDPGGVRITWVYQEVCDRLFVGLCKKILTWHQKHFMVKLATKGGLNVGTSSAFIVKDLAAFSPPFVASFLIKLYSTYTIQTGNRNSLNSSEYCTSNSSDLETLKPSSWLIIRLQRGFRPRLLTSSREEAEAGKRNVTFFCKKT